MGGLPSPQKYSDNLDHGTYIGYIGLFSGVFTHSLAEAPRHQVVPRGEKVGFWTRTKNQGMLFFQRFFFFGGVSCGYLHPNKYRVYFHSFSNNQLIVEDDYFEDCTHFQAPLFSTFIGRESNKRLLNYMLLVFFGLLALYLDHGKV